MEITVTSLVKSSIERVWECRTVPEHIIHWNAASDDWHCPAAVNDLRVGGRFCYTMAARDGSVSFDFEGEYTDVDVHQRICYSLGDARRIEICFTSTPDGILISETFDSENVNSADLQRAGWQAILDRFARYVVG
ncbi:MAG: SRPBCC domain-containing protein [Candidatus Kapabacteria bacterium]|nr:SRPBCC domain-containing protein [Candidatus Kapabacteria bacterium]